MDPESFTAHQLIRLHEMLNSEKQEDRDFAVFLFNHFDNRTTEQLMEHYSSQAMPKTKDEEKV